MAESLRMVMTWFTLEVCSPVQLESLAAPS
jgi:hypothetical protein